MKTFKPTTVQRTTAPSHAPAGRAAPANGRIEFNLTDTTIAKFRSRSTEAGKRPRQSNILRRTLIYALPLCVPILVVLIWWVRT